MDQTSGNDPITDDEILYRRIPANPALGLYSPKHEYPSLEAFRPHQKDITGISLSRKKYTTLEQAAIGQPGKAYYVAELRAGDLRMAGMELQPAPLPGDPGHAEISSLNYGNRKTDEALVLKKRLATKLTLCVRGPFPPGAETAE